MARTKLARRLTVTEIVRVYDEEVARIRGAYASLAAAEERLNATFAMESSHSISACRNRFNFSDPGDSLLEMRHHVWEAIIERLEVRRMMSIARWEELRRQIERKELPEITERSVTEFVVGFQSNLDVMLAEAVEEVFAWLRPRRSEYKRNSELEVPRRIVISFAVEEWGQLCSSWRVHYRRDQEFIAMENVFTALDGRGQIAKTHYSAISNVIHEPGFDSVGETPYFAFRTWKNGNMHLTFKRLDLLARFNAIAGGRRLRPGAAASPDGSDAEGTRTRASGVGEEPG